MRPRRAPWPTRSRPSIFDQHELGPQTLGQIAMAIQEQLDIITDRAAALWEASAERQEAPGSVKAPAPGPGRYRAGRQRCGT